MTVGKMHELFTIVLSRKDLSKAGDLFSVSDSEIVDDLADVVSAKFLKFFQFPKIQLCCFVLVDRNRTNNLTTRLSEEHE